MINPNLNMGDQLVQELVPTVMVPLYEPLQPLTKNGHRYLIARDGLYIEVRRPWLHCVWPAQADVLTLPYGEIEAVGNTIHFDWKRSTELMMDFCGIAAGELPDECGGSILWNAADNTQRLEMCHAIDAGPGHLRYERPKLLDDEHLVIDIHSHGRMKAFFSSVDDEDDFGEVKFSAVVGEVGTPDRQIVMRLGLPGGVFINDYEWQSK